MIGTRGLEVMRLMLQDHLDLRSIREPQYREVVDAEKVPYRRIEPGHGRRLPTVFGVVTVTRIAYRGLGCANLHPLDAQSNPQPGRASHGTRKITAIEAVRGSFDDARAAIARRCGVGIGKQNLEQLIVAAAADIEAYYRRYARPQPTPRSRWRCPSRARASSCARRACASRPRGSQHGQAAPGGDQR